MPFFFFVFIYCFLQESENNFLSNIDRINSLERSESTQVEYEDGLELLKKLYEDYLSYKDIETLPCILKKEENKKYINIHQIILFFHQQCFY